MANVYKAKDRMLNRFVAIKVLHSEYKEDEEFIRRFNIESQAAASLSHQNIVQIYDVGEEDGIQYIVMEFLNGRTLKEYIKSKPGGLYWKEAADYSMQICRALEHAHLKHIIHRDIKPQNIVVTPEGILKVTDFGIARAANNNTTKMNSTAIGSAHYLSPEQARGGYTDQRSDIYSLGVVMYELFTGQVPFDAETPVAVAMKHIQEEPVPPRKLNSSIPVGIEQIILKAMNKEIRLRYSNAEEVLSDLKQLYIDPDARIVSDNTENGETRVIDTKEVKRRVDETVPVVKQRTNSSSKKEEPKKHSGGSTAAIVSVIIASALVIALISTVIFARINSTLFKNSDDRKTSAEISVPSLIGMTVEEAEEFLASLSGSRSGFTLRVEGHENDFADEGTIISQTPDAETAVNTAREIKVIVSDGPNTFTLEDYTELKLTYDEIEKELSEKGVKVEKKEESSDNFPAGTIIRQEPAAGEEVNTGDTVTLYVSTGSEKNVVPSVIGDTEEEARILIERSGFVVGDVRHGNSDTDRGKVYDQSPKASSKVAMGSEIVIYISDGPSKDKDDEDETGGDNPSTEPPHTVDDPSQIEEMKTQNLTLYNLPSDRANVIIKLVCNGETIYEKSHSTDSGTAEITLKSRGTIKVDVYYDGEFVGTKEVVFD